MDALTRPRVLCLGCVDGVLHLPHKCAGDADLLPYGGRCECPRPGCGRQGDSRPLTPGTTVPA